MGWLGISSCHDERLNALAIAVMFLSVGPFLVESGLSILLIVFWSTPDLSRSNT